MPTATQTKTTLAQLTDRFNQRHASIGIIGLGYVGLPLSVTMANVGFTITGFDVNNARVNQINAGDNYIDDVDGDQFKALVSDAKIQATTDFSQLAQMDAIIICVPTPLTKNRTPDISYVESATARIAETLRPGQLIVLESTTFPGTTDEVMLPMLQASGLTVGEDFFLAYSPERVDPGNPIYQTQNTTKVVGGITPACSQVAKVLYEQSIIKVVPLSSPRAAEMVKVFENTFRAVNIGLVNELALVCDKLNLNVWEIVDACATKPFGFMKFLPGPGIGGHCIPVDPFYLTWKVKEHGIATRFIELAGEMNDAMPHFVREKVLRALGEQFKAINGSKVLVLGVAYKPDVPDWRESPAQHVLDILSQDGAILSIHDPYVPMMKDHADRTFTSEPLTAELVAQADCVVILTQHSAVDYSWVVEHAKIVVDTRNATKDVTANRDKIRLL
jgi:UDP-N-acetyl-D-glucosamine dehydrogenase